MDWRPTPEHKRVALRKAEVAARYRKKAQGKAHEKRPRTIAAIRVAELTNLFDDRWGRVLLPESDDGVLGARIMAHHLAALPDAKRRIDAWLSTCTPWLRLAERERIITDATECPIKWTADKLGWKLRLSNAERSRLKITTIGAFDLSKAEREARRATTKRERQEQRRRAQGAKTRAAYLATIKRSANPWTAAGISRATWYRQRRRETM